MENKKELECFRKMKQIAVQYVLVCVERRQRQQDAAAGCFNVLCNVRLDVKLLRQMIDSCSFWLNHGDEKLGESVNCSSPTRASRKKCCLSLLLLILNPI